jgi:hypothetical protein
MMLSREPPHIKRPLVQVCGHTTPVGAVVLNSSGVIVADAASSRISLAELRSALHGAI